MHGERKNVFARIGFTRLNCDRTKARTFDSPRIGLPENRFPLFDPMTFPPPRIARKPVSTFRSDDFSRRIGLPENRFPLFGPML
jgi:hypothetical protein